MHLTVSIPSARQEEQKLGADAGRFPKSERINVATKRELEGEKGLTSSQPERRQKTPPGLLFFS